MSRIAINKKCVRKKGIVPYPYLWLESNSTETSSSVKMKLRVFFQFIKSWFRLLKKKYD